MASDVGDTATRQAAGTLVLVVGPSGAGKDTLITYARERLEADGRFVFARRVITRRPAPSSRDHEVHDEMTETQFVDARARGEFALSWQSHGHYYGVHASTLDAVADGRVVVANVSRTVIPAAAEIAARRLVVNITASPAVLAARLAQRGRESSEQIASRVARSVDLRLAGAALAEISNEGSVEEAGTQLLGLLLQVAHFTPQKDELTP